MSVAQGRADIRMAEQVLHGYYVHAASREPGSERMAEHVPRDFLQPGAINCCIEGSADALEAIAGHRIVEHIRSVPDSMPGHDHGTGRIVEWQAEHLAVFFDDHFEAFFLDIDFL